MHPTERWIANERSREQAVTDYDILLGAMQQNLRDFRQLRNDGVNDPVEVGAIISGVAGELMEVISARSATSRRGRA